MDILSRFSTNDALDLANAVASTFSVAQGLRQLDQANRHHKLERIHSERMHTRERNQAERHFNNDHSREVEHHLHDVVSEMVSSNAEADRDMWEQKNAELQMMMLSATVVFSGGFVLAVEGELYVDASFYEEIFFALFLALGFAALLMSILLGMILSKRISFFMYAQSKARQRNVQDIIQSGQKLVEMNYARTDHARTGRGRVMTTSQQRVSIYGTDATTPGTSYRPARKIPRSTSVGSDMSDRKSSRKFQRAPSSGVRQNPQDTRAEFEIREAMAELYTALTSVPQLSFQDYYERYVRLWSQGVAHTFIFGTISLLVAASVLFWSRFNGIHENVYAASMFGAIVGAVGIVCSVLLMNYFFSGVPVDSCYGRISRVVKRGLWSIPGSNFNQLEQKLHRNLRRRVAGVGSSMTDQRTLNTLLTEEFGKMIPAAAVPLMQQVHRILREKLDVISGVNEARLLGAVGDVDKLPNLKKLGKEDVVKLFKRMVRSDTIPEEDAEKTDSTQGVGSSISVRELRFFLETEVSKHYEWNLFQENAWLLMWDVNGDGIISMSEFWRGIIRAEVLFLEEEFSNLRALYEQVETAVHHSPARHYASFREQIEGEIDRFQERYAREMEGEGEAVPVRNSYGQRVFTVFEWRAILNNIDSVALTDTLLASMFLWAGEEAFWLDRTEYTPNFLLRTETNLESRLSEDEVKNFLAPSDLVESKLVNTIDFLWREKKSSEQEYDRVVMESVRQSQRAY
mmetsp:Transcript_17654/g.67138  ORF Transcript_17654/g.67138 Transcript_17654/m.67138 type:complete len:742 (-) Transcript_17654:297-2522(-)